MKNSFLGRWVTVFIVTLCAIFIAAMPAHATLLATQTVTYDSNTGAFDQSFKAEVTVRVYNGSSATDPLGATGNWQYAYQIEHLGLAGGTKVAAIHSFTIGNPYNFAVKSFSSFAFSDFPTPTPTPGAPAWVVATGSSNSISDITETVFWDPGKSLSEYVIKLDSALNKGEISEVLVMEVIGTPTSSGGTVISQVDNKSVFSDKYILGPTPEPATLVLLGVGLVGLAGTRKRRKR